MKALARGAALLAVALLLLPGVSVSAQTVTGTIQGSVVDTTGAAVPGAAVTIRNTETGYVREVVSNDRGFYNAPFLPLGRYRVSAALSGFGTVTRDGVEVSLNATQVIDVKLDPQVREEIVVTASRPPINMSTGDIKQSMTAEQIMDKPVFLQGNNTTTFLSLAETFAGFQENPTSGQNNPTASSGSSINFNGAGTRGATFQIDGVNNDDSSENQNRQGVNLLSIKEFQVISNSYSAEFGRGYGAVVLVQTKSGTNDLHGDLFFYRQDTSWNAKSYFSTTRPDNHRNNYGGVVGFPLVKNKLHAFLSYERSLREGTQNYTRDIFTEAEKQLPRLTRGNDTPANRAFIDSVLRRFGNLQPNDPRSNRTFSGLQGIQQPLRDYSARLDWDASRSDHVVLRYQYSRQKFGSDDIIPGEATQQNNRQGNVGLTWTRSFSPRTIGEFRYGIGVRDTNVDIKAGNDSPIIRFAGSPVSASIIGNAGNFPIHRDQTDHQFVANLNTMLGNSHNLKAGTDIRRSALDDLADNFSRGFWSFSANCGGVVYPSSFAAFFDGCISSFQTAYGPFFLENRINEYNFYLEDNWKVRPNVTLNLGIRYEYAGAAREDKQRIAYEYLNDTDNVEPRIGFAWAPQWNSGFLGKLSGGPGNFSIRGGYGLYHGRIFQSVFSQGGASLRTNPPNALSLNIGNVLPNVLNVADPTLGFAFTPGPQTARHSETHADPNLEMPTTHQWNLSVERKLPWNSTMRLSYSGLRGLGLLRYYPDNLAVTPDQGGIVVANHPNNAPAAGFPDLRGVRIDRIAADVECAGTGFFPGVNPTATCPNPVPLAPNEISRRLPRTNERRPDPRFTTNLIVMNDFNAWSHGLQTTWEKRVTRGLRFEVTYTWSKAIDEGSEATFVGAGDSNQLGPDKSFARGLSRFHTPHRFTFNGTWMLPVFRNRKDWVGDVLGGWQLSGVVKIAHGTPFTIIDTRAGDINFDGFGDNRPVLLDPSINGRTVASRDTSVQSLPREAFRLATHGDYDKLIGRNTVYADGQDNVDLGLFKTFRLPKGRLQVRLEAYNAFNHPWFGFPSADLAAATFGQINGVAAAYGPRTIQGSFRFSF